MWRQVQADSLVMPREDHQLPQVDHNSMDFVNVTREYPFEYARIIFGYIMPVVLVFTLIANLLVVLVLSRRHMRTPTNIVLMSMAIVDIGTIASPSPWYLYIYTFGHHDKPLFPPASCYAHYIMTDVIPTFFHTSSIWLVLLLATQRYIYVCHPMMARAWCTVARVKRAIVAIFLVALLHQLTHFFDNVYKPTKIALNNELQDACRNDMANWVRGIGADNYYLAYYTFRILFVFIIPSVALPTLNMLLIRALRRAENHRKEFLKTYFNLVSLRDQDNRGGSRAIVRKSRVKSKLSNVLNYVVESHVAEEVRKSLVGAMPNAEHDRTLIGNITTPTTTTPAKARVNNYERASAAMARMGPLSSSRRQIENYTPQMIDSLRCELEAQLPCCSHGPAPALAPIRSPDSSSRCENEIARACSIGDGPETMAQIASSAATQKAPARYPARKISSHRQTLMLVVVLSLFLLVELPVAAVTITRAVLNSFELFHNVDMNATLTYTKLFTNLLIMISYPINFVIYCITSSEFRKTSRNITSFSSRDRANSRRAHDQQSALA